MTRVESRVGIGSAEERVLEPRGADDADRGHHAGIGRELAEEAGARVEDLVVGEREHGLRLAAGHPGGQDVGLAEHLLEAADDLVPVARQQLLGQVVGRPGQLHAAESRLPERLVELNEHLLHLAEADRFDGLHLFILFTYYLYLFIYIIYIFYIYVFYYLHYIYIFNSLIT